MAAAPAPTRMVETLPAPTPHVVAVRVEGSAGEAATNEAAVEAMIEAADNPTGLYVEIGWVWGDTPDEFADLLRDRFRQLAARPSLRRIAFVAGSYPRRTALRAEAARLDTVEIEVFPMAARSAALDWVAEATLTP